MKTATPELIALLNSTTQFMMADLLTLQYKSGTVHRYCTSDLPIFWGGYFFGIDGPLFTRDGIRVVTGIEVDTMKLNVMAGPQHYIDGVPFVAAAMNGGIDGTLIRLERAYLTDWKEPPVGTIVLFIGEVSDVGGSRNQLDVTVKSELEKLNINLPRNIYQSSCLCTVYDPICGKNRNDMLAWGTVTGNNGTGQWLQSNLGHAPGWFDQGVLTFTSGAMAGTQRTVKWFNSGQFVFALPLPHVPQAGDVFTVVPGCDKTKWTCQVKFNNLARFRAFPFIPVPETAY